MEQVPNASRVSEEPDTVQAEVVFEASETPRPELAVALTVNGAGLNDRSLMLPKLIVCGALATVKLWLTFGAAAKLAFPAWLAVIEQAPAAMIVTVEPDTVQMGVLADVKTTVSPEEAVAPTANGASPNVTLLRAPNVIVCDPTVTAKLCVTEEAAL
jgi:hypothetical protein